MGRQKSLNLNYKGREINRTGKSRCGEAYEFEFEFKKREIKVREVHLFKFEFYSIKMN